MQQRTEEWYAAKIGKLSASRIADAFDVLAKGGESQKRINYRLELVAERMTGVANKFFENSEMRWGTECEPLARAAYEAITGRMVTEVGFIDHPAIAWAGASPDGLVEDGLIEIKCPTTQTHIKYLLEGKVPDQYKPQMLWQMCCTGRTWCDFVSYDPRMPEDLQILIVRYEPTADELAEVTRKAVEFMATVNDMVDQLETLAVENYRNAA
jgi:putative phage-type endonuclease